MCVNGYCNFRYRKVFKKEAEKILVYLTKELERMWNVKTQVIPIIIMTTETISKSSRKQHN